MAFCSRFYSQWHIYPVLILFTILVNYYTWWTWWTIPWICYEKSFSEFYLSIWNQLVFNQRLQLFVQSPAVWSFHSGSNDIVLGVTWNFSLAVWDLVSVVCSLVTLQVQRDNMSNTTRLQTTETRSHTAKEKFHVTPSIMSFDPEWIDQTVPQANIQDALLNCQVEAA